MTERLFVSHARWTTAMKLSDRYPALPYLKERARQRIPHFAWEYLDSGTGAETLVSRNRSALDAVHLMPHVLAGRYTPDTTTSLFGKTYSVPFGAGPVGLSGLMWPGAEKILAKTAARKSMPYVLSTVATQTPETIAELAEGNAWFQLYVPSEPEIQADLLARCQAVGIDTLVVTVDVPVGSRRERQLVAGLTMPPKLTPLTLWRIAKRPAWALATLRAGQPRFRTLERYFDTRTLADGNAALTVGRIVDGRPSWDTIRSIRDAWPGKLIIKGLLRPEEARQTMDLGADGIVVSNHGGRQFDAAPAAIEALPGIVAEVNRRIPVLFDSGIEWGLDILRALALGADFCLLGRGFLTAVAALGDKGGDHAYDILRADIENNMIQLGARTLDEVKALPVRAGCVLSN